MGARFEKLKKLRDRLKETYHDYRPSTEIFPSLDTERLARDLALAEAAESKGVENQPPTKAKGFDEVELTVIERIENEKKTSHELVEEQLLSFSGRLARLDFEEQFNQIRQGNATSVSDFRAVITEGLDELHGLRRDLSARERDVANFQKRHGLDRAARVQEGIWFTVKIAILIVLFGLEIIMNASFLMKGSEQGFFGGMMEATAFSAVNIGAAVLLAIFGGRYLLVRSFLAKLWGLLSIVLYAASALTINIALAHYRGISETVFDGAGRLVLESIRDNPLGLPDIQSWLLFLIGLLFSLIAYIDSLFLTDPHPGYAATEKRRQKARRNYIEEKRAHIETLQDVRDEHSEAVDDIIKALSRDRREYTAILGHRAKLLELFAQHQEHLERACNQLLQIYREANRKARSDPAPAHFDKPYKLDRIKIRISDSTAAGAKSLDASIKKAQEELSVMVERLGKECADGIKKYHDLDKLYPDDVNGQAL